MTTRSLISSPCVSSPCVLVLGNEDKGLPSWLIQRASDRICIPSCSKTAMEAGLDSLNVSVAGGILCERLLTKSSHAKSRGSTSDREDALF